LPRRGRGTVGPEVDYLVKSAGAMGEQTDIGEARRELADADSQGHASQGSDARPAGLSRSAPRQLARGKRRLIILGVLILAVVFGVAVSLIATQRAADLAESQQALTNLTQVLAEQTSRTLQPVDLTLREIVDRLTQGEAKTSPGVINWGSRAMFDLLADRLKGLPQVDVLMVIGADGGMLNYSGGFPATPLNVSNRDYFRHFSTLDDHTVFVSAPVKAYLSGKWIVILSRRVNDAHGAFAGVVNAAVTLSYLEDFYHAVTAENGTVTVLRRDGVILVHYPHVETQIGRTLPAEAPWYKVLQEGGGSYRSPGYLDGVASLVSVRPLREFPLVIDATTTATAALTGWHRQTLWVLVVAVFAAGCVIFLLRIFGLQYGRLAAQNAQLESGQLRFDAVLDNMSQGLTLFDADRNLMVCNRRFAEMYGLSAEQTRPGTSFSDIIRHRQARGTFMAMTPAAYLGRAQQLVDATKSFELSNELSDGRTIFLHSQPLHGGGWVSTHEDITERRRAEAALAFMAHHDGLTELPNRTLFQQRLVEAIAMAQRGTHCALLCLDLDRFKVINDTLGHPVGDGLLCAVAGRLSASVREIDTVARLGGDEFAIIQADLTSSDEAELLAGRIIGALCQPFEIDGHRVVAGTSIGISMAPRDGTSSETLMKNADIALYLAKTEGRGTYRFFEPEMDADVQARRAVELDLRDALPAEAFELHYQPVLDLQSGVVTGFEALIRWNHPIRGLISPADFIPAAEEFGLIIPIGEWVLKEACVEAAAWPRGIDIAVNLSPAQFKGGRLLDAVRMALATSGLDPTHLVLEITESVLLQNNEDTLAVLHQLRSLGIRIALDDFGTGYSSLGYLRSFPFDKIKIDRSFIRDVDTNNDSAVIVGAIVGLARGLGMTIVAEGVETAGQLAKVRELGCAKVQGYLFSRPRPAGEVLDLIRTLRVFEQTNHGRKSELDAMRTARADAKGFPGARAEWKVRHDIDTVIALPN
jgi:diguanylate cyclase (GGDEF)-like protein/PAS domain S-box-containing protein